MKNYPSEKEARELICEIGHRMWSKQMVAANDGNITVRVGENTVLITPTGVSKGELTPDMLFKIDLDGNILESAEGYSPTSETAMHLMVYKHNKDAMPPAMLIACTSARLPVPALNWIWPLRRNPH